MIPYFFVLKLGKKPTCEIIAKRCGVVFAVDEDSARECAWEKYGNDYSCGLDVWEIPEDGTAYTVYRSEIR